ncbi:MAG: VOC family protein [Paracoccaceae bacterium]
MTHNRQPLSAKVGAITIFVSDLERSRDHYRNFLRLAPIFEDEVSAAFKVGETIVNLLAHKAVPEMVEPHKMATNGLRAVYTLPVSDVNTTVAELEDVGLTPTSGPVDRPWGIRTANFADPDGYIWEICSDL